MGGYYALAARNPEFAEAIARNLEVLKSATADGLLYGGMHYRATGMWPCIHHTFGHAKALASFLEQEAVELPEKALPAMRPMECASLRKSVPGCWPVATGGYADRL